MKYVIGNWDEAINEFKIILILYPDDGPSNFLI